MRGWCIEILAASNMKLKAKMKKICSQKYCQLFCCVSKAHIALFMHKTGRLSSRDHLCRTN